MVNSEGEMTREEVRIHNFIQRYDNRNRQRPTFEEIRTGLLIRPSNLSWYLGEMICFGYVRFDKAVRNGRVMSIYKAANLEAI